MKTNRKKSLGNRREERNRESGKSEKDVDREKTYGDWNQVSERARERRRKGEKVRRVGTSEKRGRALGRRGRENKGRISPRIVVKGKWISGRLTNREGVKSYIKKYRETPVHLKKRAEVRRYDRYRKDLESWLGSEREVVGTEKVKRPGRRRCFEAEHHSVALREGRRCGVPTVAVTSQPERREEKRKRQVTYRINLEKMKGGEKSNREEDSGRVLERTRRGRRESRRKGKEKGNEEKTKENREKGSKSE